MHDLSTMSDDYLRYAEYLMGHAETLQTARRLMGAASSRMPDVAAARAEVAAAIKDVRKTVSADQYNTWEFCAVARDPDSFAFCDGGGATADDLRDGSDDLCDDFDDE